MRALCPLTAIHTELIVQPFGAKDLSVSAYFVYCFTCCCIIIVRIEVLMWCNDCLQDLQSEIETHRDVYASLTGTGRRLLGSLSSQEDAVMLQRRLDEMNQRWHHLKDKSMAIRFVKFQSLYICTAVITCMCGCYRLKLNKNSALFTHELYTR